MVFCGVELELVIVGLQDWWKVVRHFAMAHAASLYAGEGV